MDHIFGADALQIILTGFFVGTVVGITGMGGGALMTPALLFLGVASGNASTIVTADLTAAAVYKSGGAAVHWRKGAPNLRLAGWLIAGSVPMALLGPFLLRWLVPSSGGQDQTNTVLKLCISVALLLAATTYALRLWLNLRRVRRGGEADDPDPHIRPIPTLLVGALGGLLVGITSVGSGSVIMVALLIMYPGLAALRLVGTDLVQAVPLVLAAAIANIASNGLELTLVVPLIIGSLPGSLLGSRIAPRIPVSMVRRGIVVVLAISSLALADKTLFDKDNPILGSHTHYLQIAAFGIVLLVLIPLVWGVLRKREGLPMFGTPTVAELEGESPRAPRRASSTPQTGAPAAPTGR